MIHIIAGEKGKGKTKLLIARANEDVRSITGNLVYIDKSNKHMYELSNKIRLINSRDYLLTNADEFLGFICGILSSDHDVEKIYFDSLLKIANLDENADLEPVLTKLNAISNLFNIEFVVCISVSKSRIPDSFSDQIIISL